MSKDKNIIFGGPVEIDYTKDFRSLGDFILSRLTENGDKVAIIDGMAEREITYNEIKAGALKMMEFFKRMGLKKGDIIGLSSENRLEFPIIIYGAFFMGVAITTINLTYTEDEMHHALSLTKPKIVFGSPYAIYNLNTVAEQCPFISKVIQFGEVPLIEGITMFDSLLNDPLLQPNPNFRPPPSNMEEDVVMIMLSSGTTGLPKGVQITEANVLATMANAEQSRVDLKIDTEDLVLLSIIPWFHVYGLMTMVHTSCGGVKLVMLPRFEEDLFLNCIQKYKATHSFMVPPLMVFLAKSPLVDNYDLSSLRELYCGAAPLSREVELAVMKRIPNVKNIRQGYGMSETTLGVIAGRDEVTKAGSVGVVSQGVYCKVVDPETGKTLGPFKRGELCFKGRIIMKGYIGNDEATKEMIRDGWLHTGDVGYYDNDKHFFIVDRLKELIKYKAFQVAPAELEAIILTHPKVLDAAVIGKPDESSGELPMAFVVAQPDVKVTEKEIVDFVAKKVSSAKRLRGGVQFLDEIPKNLSGKILRKELKAMLMQPKSKL